jgi:nitrogen permease regulator 3-like protein
MAESLIAILLVTGSAKGSNIVYQWPPNPSGSIRLCRPRPVRTLSQLDNQWLTSQSHRIPFNIASDRFPEPDFSNDYVWQRPSVDRNRTLIPDPIASSRSASPTKSRPYDIDEVEELLGYPAEFLASTLCPQHSSCHQKFELVIDDLAFIGHPVSFSETRPDGTPVWKFRDLQLDRGRVTTSQTVPLGPTLTTHTPSSWLQIFHMVFVLDLPDPSSSASGNVDKYFNVIYEQIAFMMTAVLFQEQIDHNFVERECDVLLNLKDSLMRTGLS